MLKKLCTLFAATCLYAVVLSNPSEKDELAKTIIEKVTSALYTDQSFESTIENYDLEELQLAKAQLEQTEEFKNKYSNKYKKAVKIIYKAIQAKSQNFDASATLQKILNKQDLEKEIETPLIGSFTFEEQELLLDEIALKYSKASPVKKYYLKIVALKLQKKIIHTDTFSDNEDALLVLTHPTNFKLNPLFFKDKKFMKEIKNLLELELNKPDLDETKKDKIQKRIDLLNTYLSTKKPAKSDNYDALKGFIACVIILSIVGIITKKTIHHFRSKKNKNKKLKPKKKKARLAT